MNPFKKNYGYNLTAIGYADRGAEHDDTIRIKIIKFTKSEWFYIVRRGDALIISGSAKNKDKARKKAVKAARKFLERELYYEVYFQDSSK